MQPPIQSKDLGNVSYTFKRPASAEDSLLLEMSYRGPNEFVWGPWLEATRDKFIAAEMRAGFHGRDANPAEITDFSSYEIMTAGFSDEFEGVRGRIRARPDLTTKIQPWEPTHFCEVTKEPIRKLVEAVDVETSEIVVVYDTANGEVYAVSVNRFHSGQYKKVTITSAKEIDAGIREQTDVKELADKLKKGNED